MVKPSIRPEEEYREEVVSIFLLISERKKVCPKFVTRSEIEREYLDNPEKYPNLSLVKPNFRRIVISKVLNSDPRSVKNAIWQKAWTPTEMS
jgi:hypothetical protein